MDIGIDRHLAMTWGRYSKYWHPFAVVVKYQKHDSDVPSHLITSVYARARQESVIDSFTMIQCRQLS